MDLLDELDTGPVNFRTFKKEIDIRVDEEYQSAEDNASTEQKKSPVLNSIDISKSSILNVSQVASDASCAPAMAGVLSSNISLLDKVKKRLNGESTLEEDEPTQSVSDDQRDDEGLGTQIIEKAVSDVVSDTLDESPGFRENELASQTQKIDDVTTQAFTHPNTANPKPALSKYIDPSPSFGRVDTQALTQKVEDDQIRGLQKAATVAKYDEHENQDKESLSEGHDEEFIQPARRKTNKLFVESDQEDDEDKPRTQDESYISSVQSRLEKIEALAAKKRTERLLREQQDRDKNQKDLEDFKKLSDLVGEDEDENEEADVSVSTVKPDKRKRADIEDELLEKYKEQVSEQLQHEERVVKTFDKNSLLAAFGINNPLNPTSSPAQEKSSPTTSPLTGSPDKVKQEDKGADFSNNVELSESSDGQSDFEATQLFDEESVKRTHGKTKPQFVVKTPLNNDKSGKSEEVVELDSESDSDLDVAPSKVTRLEVKSRFSKQTINKLKVQRKKVISKNQLLSHLKEKSRLQLKKQTDANEKSHKAALEEVATEQEAVDKLLDRYIAAANRTREKEKDIEKQRQLAEERGEEFDDRAYSDEDDVGEVPDSDVEDDENMADSEESDESEEVDEENLGPVHRKHRKTAAVLDEEDEADEIPNVSQESNELKSKLEKDRSGLDINLGSFGGNFSQKLDSFHNNSSQNLKNILGISMTQAFETESPKVDAGMKVINVFDQLRSHGKHIIGEESFVESSLKENSFSYSINSQRPELGFDEPPTQLSEVEAPTQALSTQRDSIATLHDSIPRESLELTMKDATQAALSSSDNEDGEAIPTRKRLFKKHDKKTSILSDEEEDEAETEEQMKERRRQVELMREKIRKRELEAKRKKLEIKKKGLDKIMENEAEESEDEWQGLGGVDGERSDDENSEDEKMLDDYSKLKLNESQIAKLIANENLQSDEKMLHRILNDVNNGGFRKRGKRDGVELEFSDEEDAYLQHYNRVRNERIRARLLEDGNIAKLSKDAKSKAFFESITEDSQNAGEVFGGITDSDENTSSNEEKESDPFNDKPEITKKDFKDPSTAAPKKRRLKITEAYVQKSLSFLKDDEEDEIERASAMAAHQHGFIDEFDDFTEDMSTLKQRSIIRLPDTTPKKKSTIDLTNESDQSPEKFFKMPSRIMKSFQSNSNDSFKNSNEVTISTAYKAATSSKASIMSFGKNNSTNKVPTKIASAKTQDTRILKARKVEKTTNKGNRLRRLDIGNFE